MRRLPASLFATMLLAAPVAAEPATDQPTDPAAWAELQAVRDALAEASPLAVAFVQTYTPAGFSTGESESGTLALDLPECLRWDYAEPEPKSFLLCGDIAWQWNLEDGAGRRQLLADEDLFGLDLLRLGVEELREHYDARVLAREADRVTLRLDPLEPAAEIRDARLELDRQARRLLAISYHDAEDNLTRFEFGDYRGLEVAGGLFDPPAGIEWVAE